MSSAGEDFCELRAHQDPDSVTQKRGEVPPVLGHDELCPRLARDLSDVGIGVAPKSIEPAMSTRYRGRPLSARPPVPLLLDPPGDIDLGARLRSWTSDQPPSPLDELETRHRADQSDGEAVDDHL
jgi:hypothetical protein